MDREVVELFRTRPSRPAVIDFHNKRAIVFMDVSWMDVKHLERIETDQRGRKMGAVLIKREWKELYAVNIHDSWEDQKYFDYAQGLIDEG